MSRASLPRKGGILEDFCLLGSIDRKEGKSFSEI
jgi:hypothetical protein